MLVDSQPTQASKTWPFDVVVYADSSQTIMSSVVEERTLPHCVPHGDPFATSKDDVMRQSAAKVRVRYIITSTPSAVSRSFGDSACGQGA